HTRLSRDWSSGVCSSDLEQSCVSMNGEAAMVERSGSGQSRRGFLKAGLAGGAALAGSLAAGRAMAADDPAITEIQDWNRYAGDGVEAHPYGMPSPFEKDVVRRNVPWLTADPISSVNFTPLHKLEGIITP